MRNLIITLIVGTVVGAAWVQAQSLEGDPRNGRRLYEQHCLACHGEELRGNGPDARFLIVPPANLQTPAIRAKTDEELLGKIYHGVAFSPMHGFHGRLTDQQILDILAYIRTVAPFDAIG